MENLPLLLLLSYALYSGLTHAFEADHVLAVSNLVTQRNRVWVAVKDGIYWGLGHSSTIFVVGILMLIFKLAIPDQAFSYFEAFVGLMLIVIATYRIVKFVRDEKLAVHTHPHTHSEPDNQSDTHTHVHYHQGHDGHSHSHKAAYGIGLIHGLAGSGALIVLVMAQIPSTGHSLLYLLTFGMGSVVGMVLIAGVFSIPFSKKLMTSRVFRAALILVSSVLCFAYGGYVVYENLLA